MYSHEYSKMFSVFGEKEPLSYVAITSASRSIFLFIGLSALFFIPTFLISQIERRVLGSMIKITLLHDISTSIDFLLFNPLALVLFLRFFGDVDVKLRVLLSSKVAIMNSSILSLNANYQRMFSKIKLYIIVALATVTIMILHTINTLKYESYFAVTNNHQLSASGWYMIVITSIYLFICIVCVFRSLAIIHLLRCIYKAGVKVDFLNEDKCGGLSYLGHLSVALNRILFVFALTFCFFAYNDVYVFHNPLSIRLYLGLPIYFIVAPILFFGPLITVHTAMLSIKKEYLKKLRRKINQLFNTLQGKIEAKPENELITTNLTMLQQLLNIYNRVEEMPVWPIDIKSYIRFLATFFISLISFILQLIINVSSVVSILKS